MGITEILRRIWLFSANKMKSSESFSKQPTKLIVELNSSLRQIIDSTVLKKHQFVTWHMRMNVGFISSLGLPGTFIIPLVEQLTSLPSI